ncbi:MAG: hypothetical protein K0Q87_218 [Neobacillus sp.]|jgi:hypothetical protein|nr:hypothetical protein [Neobacillus sp.]
MLYAELKIKSKDLKSEYRNILSVVGFIKLKAFHLIIIR